MVDVASGGVVFWFRGARGGEDGGERISWVLLGGESDRGGGDEARGGVCSSGLMVLGGEDGGDTARLGTGVVVAVLNSGGGVRPMTAPEGEDDGGGVGCVGGSTTLIARAGVGVGRGRDGVGMGCWVGVGVGVGVGC
ncbi:hypothetical protein HanPSC8_Chr06g0238551 [Helianthus annuus]|nr:hypothetical protein HanPSC8_Chr06g0238551 [Helianthus annuus]